MHDKQYMILFVFQLKSYGDETEKNHRLTYDQFAFVSVREYCCTSIVAEKYIFSPLSHNGEQICCVIVEFTFGISFNLKTRIFE